jgi:TPR repeat protein
MTIIVVFVLLSGAVLAQKQVEVRAPKGTLSPVTQDHLRWLMDEKSWRLPNAVDIRTTRTAARQGDPSAQFKLSLMYEVGYGLLQNELKAVKWLRRAAEQDFLPAQYNLGSRYASGEGVTQDYVSASRWFRKAAEQGHAPAQKNLGALYGRGEGVPQDFSEAYIWSSLATRSGVDGAIKNRNLAASELSQDDLQVAEKRALQLYDEIQRRRADSSSHTD